MSRQLFEALHEIGDRVAECRICYWVWISTAS